MSGVSPSGLGNSPRGSALRAGDASALMRASLTRHRGAFEGGAVDFGQALVEAWAAMVDVFAFYQDRIGAECYLNTATELWSLRELARLVGYTPRVGTAATGYLSFTITDAPGLVQPVVIPAGTAVQSVPQGGANPQVFETSETLEALTITNAMTPFRAPAAGPPTVHATTRVVCTTRSAPVRPGDAVMITSADTSNPSSEPGTTLLRQVRAVGRTTPDGTTAIELILPSTPSRTVVQNPIITRMDPLGPIFGHDAADWSTATPRIQEAFGVLRAGLYVEGTKAWTPAANGLSKSPITAIVILESGQVLVGTATAGVFTTPTIDTDSWTPSNLGLTSKDVTCLAAGADGTLYVGTGNGGVFRSVDGGQRWDTLRGLGTLLSATSPPSVQTSTRLPSTTVRSLAHVPAGKVPSSLSSVVRAIVGAVTRSKNDATLQTRGESGTRTEGNRPEQAGLAPLSPGVRAVHIAESIESEVHVAQRGDGGHRSAVHRNEPRQHPEATAKLGSGSKGIDVSIHQRGTLKSWPAIATSRQFVIIRASEGLSIDKRFLRFRAGARAAGLVTGLYHFAYPHNRAGDAKTQAKFFFDLFDGNDGLVPSLDFEEPTPPKHSPPGTIAHYEIPDSEWATWALEFLDALSELCGQTPMLYTNLSSVNRMGKLPSRLVTYPLWTAGNRHGAPHLPAAWSTYAIWQSGQQLVAGNGNREKVDVDVLGPDFARALWSRTEPPEPEPPQPPQPPEPEPQPPQPPEPPPGSGSSGGSGPSTLGAGPFLLAGTDQGLFCSIGPNANWQVVGGRAASATVHAVAAVGPGKALVAANHELLLLDLSGGSEAVVLTRKTAALAVLGPTWWAATSTGCYHSTDLTSWSLSEPTRAFGPVVALTSSRNRLVAATARALWEFDGTHWTQVVNTPILRRETLPPERIALDRVEQVQVLGLVPVGAAGSKIVAVSDAPGFVNALTATSARFPHATLATQWPNWTVPPVQGRTQLDLATSKAAVCAGQTIVIANGPTVDAPTVIAEVSDVEVVARSDYGISATVTRLTLLDPKGELDSQLRAFDIRQVRVFVRPDPSISPTPGRRGTRAVAAQPTAPRSPAAVALYGRTRPSDSSLSDATDSATASPTMSLRPSSSSVINDERAEPIRGGRITVQGSIALRPGRLLAITGRASRAQLEPAGGLLVFGEDGTRRWCHGWDVTAMTVCGETLVTATKQGPMLKGDPLHRSASFAPDLGGSMEEASDPKASVPLPDSFAPVPFLLTGDVATSPPASAGRIDDKPGVVRSLVARDDVSVIVGTENGHVFSWNLDGSAQLLADLSPGTTVQALLILGQADSPIPDMLIGTNRGAWRLTPSGEVEADGLTPEVRMLLPQKNGSILAATIDGVWSRARDGSGWARLAVIADETVPLDVVSLVPVAQTADFHGGVLAVTARHGIFLGGPERSWNLLRPAPPFVLTSASQRRDGVVFVAGIGGEVLVWWPRTRRWTSLSLGTSNAAVCMCPVSNAMAVGTLRSTVATDAYDRAYEIRPTPILPTGDDQQEWTAAGKSVADGLDRGLVHAELTKVLAKANVVLPSRVNVTVLVPKFQWEIEGVSPPIIVTRCASGLTVDALPIPMPVVRVPPPHVASPPPTTSVSTPSRWTLSASGSPVVVDAYDHELRLVASDPTQPTVSEVVTVTASSTSPVNGSTFELSVPLVRAYDSATVTISANVVKATQGETVALDVLGSGGAQSGPSEYALHKGPLTWVVGADGEPKAELSLWVGQRRFDPFHSIGSRQGGGDHEAVAKWTEVSSLLDAGPTDHSYMVRSEADEPTTLVVGDGVFGAAMPVGIDNVSATYRTGIGGSALPAGSLTVLRTTPMGVRGVLNPVPTVAGATPEQGSHLRSSIPRSTLRPRRIITLDDYAAFASAYPGVGHCDVVQVRNGLHRCVVVTIGDTEGVPFGASSPVPGTLANAIRSVRAGEQPFEVMTYEMQWFAVRGRVRVRRETDVELFRTAAIHRLLDNFGAPSSRIAKSVRASIVEAALLTLPGVMSVQLEIATESAPEAQLQLSAPGVRFDGATMSLLPAAVLALDPAQINIAIEPGDWS